MEKASSGSSRLTRRSAAQKVKTPPKAVADSEENGNFEEEPKKGSSRKGRPRKSETKPKTNGESSIKPEGVEANSLDGCESESSVTSEKQKPTNTNNCSTPTPRKSTRVRRSVTPGPESEASRPKKLRRSTSESKLDSITTPTKRRGGRAQSESKDFVFTPTKDADQSNEPQVLNKDLRTNTIIAPAVESIAEDEEESSNDDPIPLAEYAKKIKSKACRENDSSKQDQEVEEKRVIESKESPEVSVSGSKTDNTVKASDKTQIVNNESRNDVEALVVEKTEQIEVGSKTEHNVSTATVESSKEGIEQLEPVVTKESENLSSSVEETHRQSNQLYETVVELKVLDDEYNTSQILEEERIQSVEPKEDSSEPSGNAICDKIETNESLENEFHSPREENHLQEDVEEVRTIVCVSNVLPEDKVENLPSEQLNAGSKLQPCRAETEEKSPKETYNEKEFDTSNKVETGTDSTKLEIENMECEDDQVNLESPKDACEDSQSSLNEDKRLEVNVESLKEACGDSQSSLNEDRCLEVNVESPKEACGDSQSSLNEDKRLEVNVESPKEACGDSQSSLNEDKRLEVNLESPKDACENSQSSLNEEKPLEVQAGDDNTCNLEVYNSQQVIEDASNTLTSADLGKDEQTDDTEAVLIEDSNDNTNEDVENINLSYHEEGNDCPENKEPAEPEEKSSYQFTNDSRPISVQIENSIPLVGVSETGVDGKNNVQESDPIEIWDDCSEEEPLNIKIVEAFPVSDINGTDHLEKDSATNHEISSEESLKESMSKGEEENNEETEILDDEKCYSSSEDIYKDMSNFGSEDEDQKDYERNGSLSSSSQSVDSLDTIDDEEEEDEDEEDYEEEEEEEQDSETRKEEDGKKDDQETKLEKIPTQEIPGNKAEANRKELVTEEGSLESPSPMTYDKALEILNKDRDNKIDDEEFFDMFTQELNKVSEAEANSDSDIAIVDEYIPENPPKPKPVLKTIKIQRPIQRPQAPMQQQYPPPNTHFAGHFNQIQHQPPPNIPKVSFPQDVPLNQHHPQYLQDLSHMNAMRNQNIYKHYGPSASNAPDPHMYEPIPTEVPLESHGFFGYKMGHPVENTVHFPNSLGLKVRNMDSLSMSSHADHPNQNCQPSHINNQMFYEPQMSTHSRKLEDKNNAPIEHKVGGNYESDRPSSPEHGTSKSQTPTSKKEGGKVNTPILNLLGLDKNKRSVIKSEFKKLEKRRPKHKWTKLEKQKKRALIKHLLAKMEKEDFLSPSGLTSCEVSNDCSYPGSSRDKRYQDSSTDSSSSGSESSECSSPKPIGRRICLKKDSISVTIPRRNRQRQRKSQGVLVNERDTNIETLFMRRKRKKGKRKFTTNQDSSEENFVSSKKRKLSNQQDDSDSEDKASKSKNKKKERSTQTKLKKSNSSSSLFTKMVQKKQKKTGFLQSNCGVFTVEKPASATSQSSESEGASQSSSSDYLESVKRRLKTEVTTGKNRLSNIFTQQSFKTNSKKLFELKTGRVEKRRKRPARGRVLKKLPVDILEQLEEEKKEKQVSTDSDIDRENKKKKKKSKVKVKSAALDKEYIPYVTPDPVATQFALNRLDVDDVLTTARSAARFRSGQLYGSSVQRITSKELMNIKKKQERTNPKRK